MELKLDCCQTERNKLKCVASMPPIQKIAKKENELTLSECPSYSTTRSHRRKKTDKYIENSSSMKKTRKCKLVGLRVSMFFFRFCCYLARTVVDVSRIFRPGYEVYTIGRQALGLRSICMMLGVEDSQLELIITNSSTKALPGLT